MIEAPGALLGALRTRNDWVNLKFPIDITYAKRCPFQNAIELTFATVLDLKESEIIESLKFIISQHRLSTVQLSIFTVPSDNAMQSDTPAMASSTTAITSLPTFLNLSITYPTSRPLLVSAVRKELRDAEELTILLEILDKWLIRRTAMEEKLFPGKKDLKKTEYGVWIVAGKTAENRKLEEIPPLNKVNLRLDLIFTD